MGLEDALVLVEDVREAGVHLLDVDLAASFQLAPEIDEELGDIRPRLELVLDAGQNAAVIPERALLARAPLRVACRDQLDRAELPVLCMRAHGLTMSPAPRLSIGAAPDAACGKVRNLPRSRAVDAFDLDVRRHVYFSVVANGRPPTVSESAAAFGLTDPELAAAYRRLHDAHVLVLFPESTEVWMANPFCFAPTPHRVTSGGRTWTGTCAWDSLGIPAALHGEGSVETACACCEEPLRLVVENGELVDGSDVLVHFLVPARRWWDDIGFT